MADDYVAVKRLSARLVFLPLLQGRMQFRELVLQRPEARITRTSQGAIDFVGRDSQPPQGASAVAVKPDDPFDLDVARIEIEDGSIVFQDAANGTSVHAEGIDLKIAAPVGAPVSLEGNFVVGNTLMAVDAIVGRGVPHAKSINITLKLLEADATAKFSGTVSGDALWNVRGDIGITGTSSAAMLGAFGLAGPDTALPAAMRKPFSLTAKVNGDPQGISADPLSFDIGGTSAKGSVVWRAEAPPKMNVKLEFGTLQIEAWRFAFVDMPPASPFNGIMSAHAQEPPRASSDALYAPFKDLSATFDIRFPLLSYGGQMLQGGFIEASLAAGELTLSNVSFELPSATRVKAFGMARFNDTPSFDGSVEVQTTDLRGLMACLGTKPDPDGRLQDRLKNASLRAAVQGTSSTVMLSDITATVDTSGITGRMSWSRNPRTTIAADLKVNAFNLDAYLPAVTRRETAQATTPAPAAPPAAKPDPYGVHSTSTPYHALADFDADVHVEVASLTAGGSSSGKAGIDLQLKDGALNVRSASFENVGSVSAWVGGTVNNLDSTPSFENVQFDISATDLGRAGRAFAFDVPAPLKGFTPISFTAVASGSMAQATIAGTLKAAGLTIRADGEALTLDQQPHVTLNVEATQGSYAALMRAMGRVWPVSLTDPGALKMTARVVRDETRTTVDSIDLRLGDNALMGNVSITKGQNGPEVTGAFNVMAPSADKIWPKQPEQPFATPVSLIKTAPRAAAKPVWSEDAFDWSFLKGWRGDVQVAGKSLAWRGIQVQNFATQLTFADGTAELGAWNGKVFNAPGQLYLKVATAPMPLIQGEIAFIGGDLAGVASAVNGGSGTLKSGGKADFAGSFRAQGASPAAMISNLSGNGTVKLTATETGSGPIAGLLSAIAAVNQLEGISGGRAGTVSLESRLSAAEGRIKIEDTTVASKSYGGVFSGSIDLARWQVDLAGRLRLEARGEAAARPTDVPITIKGALDLPNITLLPR